MKSFALLIALGFVTGCTFEATDPPDEYGSEEEDLGMAMSATAIENSLIPNGLIPNGLIPNGLIPNGLTPAAVNTANMNALQNPTEVLSRLLMKYIVSCSLLSGQTFQYTYNDGVEHTVTHTGALGLAPEWASGAISASKARLVSACVASRTNFDGIQVLISLRSRLVGADSGEKALYNNQEGAFFGDLFAVPPKLYSCYNAPKMAYARSKNRKCAAGNFVDPNTVPCGVLTIVGSCSTYCTNAADPDDGYESCTYNSVTYDEPITSWLD